MHSYLLKEEREGAGGDGREESKLNANNKVCHFNFTAIYSNKPCIMLYA